VAEEPEDVLEQDRVASAGRIEEMSVNNIVTAPASTGITRIIRYAVTSQVHTNIGIFISVMPGARMLIIVVTMLMEPMIEDTPRIWMAKMAMSIPGPICTDSGG
jgi:hypothetical protein